MFLDRVHGTFDWIQVMLATSNSKWLLSHAILLVWAGQECCVASEKRKNDPSRLC